MKQFENDLKSIQLKCDLNNGFVLSNDINISNNRLTVLKAKGLINTKSYYDNVFKITLTDSGVTYFIDKDNAREQAARSRIETLLFNLLSAAAGSAITLFIQWLVK